MLVSVNESSNGVAAAHRFAPISRITSASPPHHLGVAGRLYGVADVAARSPRSRFIADGERRLEGRRDPGAGGNDGRAFDPAGHDPSLDAWCIFDAASGVGSLATPPPSVAAEGSLIEVDRLTKLYAGFPAVGDLSFRVAPGEILGLVGPNGAGKTTTLRSIAGIIVPTSGRIRIAGVDLLDQPQAAKARLAFVPDEPQLFDYLTVEEHLRFVGRLYGVADVQARTGPLLAELELADKARALPSELSRGMRQKLAIACGLLHEPSALLLDEPLTGLDPGGIRKMKGTIAGRARAGTAVILSSHLLNLVEELCTRLLFMQRGRIVAVGTIAEIVAERPALAGLGLEDIFLALTGHGEGEPAGR